jgi:NAD-dependent SIR2 family protein deacetylase
VGLTFINVHGEEQPMKCHWCWSQQAVVRLDVKARKDVPLCNPCKATVLDLEKRPPVPLEVRRVS